MAYTKDCHFCYGGNFHSFINISDYSWNLLLHNEAQQCSNLVPYIENLLRTNSLLTTRLNIIFSNPDRLSRRNDITSDTNQNFEQKKIMTLRLCSALKII